jgi:hypothetical protein
MNIANQHGAFGAEFFHALRKIGQQTGGFCGLGDFVGANIDYRRAGANP